MDNLYMPQLAVIDNIVDETYDTKTFTLHFSDEKYNNAFSYRSGQFVEVSVFGVGEAPFGFCSNPLKKGDFAITVRATGQVTNAMHELQAVRAALP